MFNLIPGRVMRALFSAGLTLALVLSGCLPSAQSSPTASQDTVQPPADTPLPAPTLFPPAAPTQLPVFPLAGNWTGSAKNGTYEMQVTMFIENSCDVGSICGTFDLHLPCSGNFTLVGEDGGIYEFKAGNKLGTCGAGRDFLQLLSDGSLQYTSQGDYGETLGKLVRNDSASVPAAAQNLPVIYDDDGSPDGTSALLYLISRPDVDVKAADISYGEAHPAVYIQYIGGLLDAYGFSNIPLGVGPDAPLSGNNGFPEAIRQAAGTFWGWPIQNANKAYPVHDSAGLIVSILKQSTKPVTLFFSGPLTNLARALRMAPEISQNIAAVFIMGGAVYVPGNVHDFYPDSANVYAEWNIYADPQAAAEVFSSNLKLYLVPLDATNQVLIDKQDTVQWRAGGRIANFAADIYDSLLNSTGKLKFAIWDLMTSEIMVTPELCGFQQLHLDVIADEGAHSGQTQVAAGMPPNVNVCLQPNGVLIKQTLVDVFSKNR